MPRSEKCILRTYRLSLAEWSHHSSVMHSSTVMNSNRSITPWSSVYWCSHWRRFRSSQRSSSSYGVSISALMTFFSSDLLPE